MDKWRKNNDGFEQKSWRAEEPLNGININLERKKNEQDLAETRVVRHLKD